MKALGHILLGVIIITVVIALSVAAIAYSYHDTACAPYPHDRATAVAPPHAAELSQIPDYGRPAKTTYLTFPEWYIVYSAREYGAFLSERKPPSGFPYRESIGRYWCSYRAMEREAAQYSQIESLDSVMFYVIGSSYSAEYLLKDIYEHTIGRLTELIGGADTPEDRYYARMTSDYAKFLEETPWYDFPFTSHLLGLWKEPTTCPFNIRSCERRALYSVELLLKALYGKAIGFATHAAYTPANLSTMILAEGLPAENEVRVIQTFKDDAQLASVPRYQEFTDLMPHLAAAHARILDLAGNQTVLISALSPSSAQYALSGTLLMEMGTANPGIKRSLILIPVRDLLDVVAATSGASPGTGFSLEHIYDY